jgi:hypothetical protein
MIYNYFTNKKPFGYIEKVNNPDFSFEIFINLIDEKIPFPHIIYEEMLNQITLEMLKFLPMPIEHSDDRISSHQIINIFDNQNEGIVIGNIDFIKSLNFDETSEEFKGQINGYDFYENENLSYGQYLIFPVEFYSVNKIEESILKLEDNEMLYSMSATINMLKPKNFKILLKQNLN